jgi:hypothetical protein
MNPSDSLPPGRLDRRTAIKWMMAAAATVALVDRLPLGAAPAAGPTGYGTDPDLTKPYHPGDYWPLTFTAEQRRTATALCDVIIPADATSPAASAVGVPDFIDEWISAPYPTQVRDRAVVLEGLAWMDDEARKRFGRSFADLDVPRQRTICDDICYAPEAGAAFKTAAAFFNRYRDLTSGGFYTTPVGMKDIGYVGNMPTPTFAGPTPEALKHLGLA